MGLNLSEVINEYSLDKLIQAWYEGNNKPRTRLGISSIGHPCGRYLWYSHHGFVGRQPGGRVLMLFELGNIVEEQLILDMKRVGIIHHSAQKEVSVTNNNITLLGHIDGIVEGLMESKQPHLWECKTANEKSFKKLVKLNSYEQWDIKYKTQIHVYMLLLKLKRCLVTVYCKNNSELYTDRIKIDRDFAIQQLERVFKAIDRKSKPPRKCPNASWFEAKWCSYYSECFGVDQNV